MVGPKKQDFWPKINMLITQKKSLYFGNKMNISSSKIRPDFRNKVLHKFEVRKKSLEQKRAS